MAGETMIHESLCECLDIKGQRFRIEEESDKEEGNCHTITIIHESLCESSLNIRGHRFRSGERSNAEEENSHQVTMPHGIFV